MDGAFRFGDSPELADELGRLVVEGFKTATVSAHCLFEIEGEALPQAGQRFTVLSGTDEPMAVIETTEVFLSPMNEVSEAFALAEGEGDYRQWWDGHARYFTRVLAVHGIEFREDLLLVCERFKVVGSVPDP